MLHCEACILDVCVCEAWKLFSLYFQKDAWLRGATPACHGNGPGSMLTRTWAKLMNKRKLWLNCSLLHGDRWISGYTWLGGIVRWNILECCSMVRSHHCTGEAGEEVCCHMRYQNQLLYLMAPAFPSSRLHPLGPCCCEGIAARDLLFFFICTFLNL